jgi:hypothetical protein
MKDILDDRMTVFIVILAIGSISGILTAQFVIGSDGDTLKNLLGGCIYGACKDTKITGNFTNGTLAGCVFGACNNVQITGKSTSSQPSPNTATLIVTKVFDCPGTAGCGGNAFTITVTGNNPSPDSFTASTKGTEVTLGPGLYKVSETSPDGFVTSFTDDCNSNSNGPIKAGETRTCTVTNTQQVG